MKKSEDLARRIRSRMALLDVDQNRMAIKMRMSVRTWQRKIASPEKLTVGELERIEKILHFDIIGG